MHPSHRRSPGETVVQPRHQTYKTQNHNEHPHLPRSPDTPGSLYKRQKTGNTKSKKFNKRADKMTGMPSNSYRLDKSVTCLMVKFIARFSLLICGTDSQMLKYQKDIDKIQMLWKVDSISMHRRIYI